MNPHDPQTQILAQAIFEIRVLLAAYLGSQNKNDIDVRRAAHLAYAISNEALDVIEGRQFDAKLASERIKQIDHIFDGALCR